jgi:parvulin-like peptidyl-prolyl isomerase
MTSVSCTRRDPVVARYSGGEVGCSELQWFASSLPPRSGRQREGESIPQWKRRLGHEEVADRLLAAEAMAAGAESNPVFAERYAEGRRRVLLAAIEREIGTTPKPTVEAVRAYYQQHRDRYRSPEKISTRLLLLRVDADAPESSWQAAEARARLIRAEFERGKPFAELVRQHSQADNAGRGGTVAAVPRGTLLPAYEQVAWGLKPGQVSAPVRLPDGVALILLEQRFAARERTFDQAKSAIEKAIQREQQQARRRAALEDARRRWPVRLDLPSRAQRLPRIDAVVARVGGAPLTFEDLNVPPGSPRLRERVEVALERHLLFGLAEARGFEDKPAVAASLRFRRRTLLVAFAMDRRLKAATPPVPEAELRRLYQEHLGYFQEREQRNFEVLTVAGAEGKLRGAHSEAERVAESWRRSGAPPAGRLLDRWGPIERGDLSTAFSPAFAKRAFELSAGAVSAPLLMETYRGVRFVGEGYAILRVASIVPVRTRPFEAVRSFILRYATREAAKELPQKIRAQVVDRVALQFENQALEACVIQAQAIHEKPKAHVRAGAAAQRVRQPRN